MVLIVPFKNNHKFNNDLENSFKSAALDNYNFKKSKFFEKSTTTDSFKSSTTNTLSSNNYNIQHHNLINNNNNITDSKLFESINILKNIIDRISKVSFDNNISNSKSKSNANNITSRIKNDPSDSFDNLFALAKNSVTLSFKDYILLHKTATNKPAAKLDLYSSSSMISTTPNLTKSYSYSTNTMLKYTKQPTINVYDVINSFFSATTKLASNSAKLSQINDTNVYEYTTRYTKATTFVDLDMVKNSVGNLADSDVLINNNSTLLIGIAFFYSILVITSLTSNPLLIYVLLWRRKAQIKIIDIFVANLSLSDLFLTIFNIPLCLIIYFSEQWPFGSLLCQLGTYSTSCSIYVNIFTMAYISIDRYFAVTRPLISNPNYQLRKKSILTDDGMRRKIYLVLTLIWIISLILSVPQFLFSKVSTTKITNEKDYLTNMNNNNEKFINIQYGNTNEVIEKMFTSTLRMSANRTSTSQMYDNASNSYEKKSDIEGDLFLLHDVNRFYKSYDFGEDPFKRCILEYPVKNMKTIMVIINFSLQYLIPSIVILYFYGKIIYHLYLNLNVEELMESPSVKKIAKKQTKSLLSRSRTTHEIDKNNLGVNSAILSASTTALNENNPINIQRKKSRMRIEGLNRTRNLKKSIKVMIIIIALFLLSWLPLHIYRLVTTFYPLILQFLQNNSSEMSLNTTNSTNFTTPADKQLIFPKPLTNQTASESNYKVKTLHNRYVFFFCYFMAMSSVCYNPIVYFWMHKKFRAEVKQIFGRIFKWSSRNRREDETSRPPPSLVNSNMNPNANPNLPTSSNYFPLPKTNKFGFISNKFNKNANPEQSKAKKKNGGIMNSFRIRSKRFSSLSSESTASSNKRSEH